MTYIINSGWRGNKNIKPFGHTITYTKEQLEEYLKCSGDVIYFIETYCKIISLDHGLVPFEMYDFQKRFVKTLHKERKIISMQPRQSGKTITVAAYLLHYVLFNDNVTVALLANKAAAAREILSRFQLMYENLPLFIQQGVKEWNKGSCELENGSKVFTAATSSSGIRGRSCVTGDTKICVEHKGSFFYVEIDNLLNNSRFINVNEEDHMIYTVYETTNKKNNKIYIGFHKTIKDNIIDDVENGSCFRDGYLGSGKLIKRAIEKYGAENFTQRILGSFDTKESAEQFEASIVDKSFTLRDDTYNLAQGGNVRILYGENNGFYGKKHSPKTLDRIKQTRESSNLPTYQFTITNNITGEIYKGYAEALTALCGEIPPLHQRRLIIGEMCYNKTITINKEQHHNDIISYYENHIEHMSLLDERTEDKRLRTSKRFKNKKQSSEQVMKRRDSYLKWIDDNPEKHLDRMNKINKNVDKIRRTAEKHRGMKRTEQAKNNMSIAQREFFANNESHSKGRIWICNKSTNESRMVLPDSDIPTGWERGTLPKPFEGKKLYNNGVVAKLFNESDVPIGWVPGKLKKK